MSTISKRTFLSLTVALGITGATVAAPGAAHAATCPAVSSNLGAVSFSAAPPFGGGIGMREEPGRLVYVASNELRIDIDVPTLAFVSAVRANGAIVPPPNSDSFGLSAQVLQGPVGPGCQMHFTVVLSTANRGRGDATPISIQLDGLGGGSTTIDFTLIEVEAIDRNARLTFTDGTLRNRLVMALRTRFLGTERIGRIYNPYFNVNLEMSEGHGRLTAQMKFDIPSRPDQTVTVSGRFHFSDDGLVVWDSGDPTVGLEYWPEGSIPVFSYTKLRNEVRGFVAQVLTSALESAVRDELGAAFAFELVDHVEMHEGQVDVVLGALTSYTIELPYDTNAANLWSPGVPLPAFASWVAVASGIARVRQENPQNHATWDIYVDPHGLPNLNDTVPGWDGGLPADVLAGRQSFFDALGKQNRDSSTLPLGNNDPGVPIAQIEGEAARRVLGSPCNLGAAGAAPRRIAFAVNDAPGRGSGSYELTLVKWPFGGRACPAPHPHMFGANRTHWMWVWGAIGFLGDALANQQWEPDARGVSQPFANGELVWTGTTGSFALLGEFRARWTALGRGNSVLGYPMSDESANPDAAGMSQRFENGAMYRRLNAPALFVIHGIHAKYVELGQQASFLGYPTTDELVDGIGGAFNDFENGRIAWGPGPGVGMRAMGWQIRNRWQAEGAAPGHLGYPISDEAPVVGVPGGRSVRFQRGTIFFHPSVGTSVG